MELVFNRPCAHRNIAQHVGQIKVVFGIKHLVRAGKARFTQRFYMQFADCDKPFEHVFACMRIGLMQHTLVAVARGTRLVGVYTRNDKDFVLHLLLHVAKPRNIVQNGVLSVRRTRAYHQNKSVVLSLENVFECDVSRFFCDASCSSMGYIAFISCNVGSFLLNSKFILILLVAFIENLATLCRKAHHLSNAFSVVVLNTLFELAEMLLEKVHLFDDFVFV